jgi:hypothetical protein
MKRLSTLSGFFYKFKCLKIELKIGLGLQFEGKKDKQCFGDGHHL